jgi:type I restriction enzyme S subunit
MKPADFIQQFERLSDTPDAVSRLRRFILDLAVRGKLALQIADDEPAPELVSRVQAEKLLRIKEGTLRKEKPLALTVDDETAPFPIPSGWVWTRIGICSLLTEYGTSVKADRSEIGVPVLGMSDIQGGRVMLGNQKRVPSQIDDLPQLFLKRFDLLYNRTNSAELVGKTGIYLGDDDAYTFASYLIRIRFLRDFTDPVYCNIAMNAPYFRDTQIVPELRQQCGQANVNGSKLRNMLVPLPPLAEQHRIVAKVDELMSLCDQLENSINDNATKRKELREAMLYHALYNGRNGLSHAKGQ